MTNRKNKNKGICSYSVFKPTLRAQIKEEKGKSKCGEAKDIQHNRQRDARTECQGVTILEIKQIRSTVDIIIRWLL